MSGDLSRVLADIDSLLPPGAPSDDLITPDAMRWSPVDHDDHPETVRASQTRTFSMRFRLENVSQELLRLLTGYTPPPIQAAAAAIDNLIRDAQSIGTSLQRLQHHADHRNQAQTVIEARRNRNTGPTNPRGIDGRARRHQRPRKAAARHASPATHGAATPVIVTWRDGALAMGFDPAWQ